jgi:Ser/Thr protein kinase RdoA (MazF antagonist)
METTEITPPMMNEIISELKLKATSLKFLKYSQNFVYSYANENVETILRITSGHHRTRAQIESEIEWLAFLYSKGANVCQAIPIIKDTMVKTIHFQNDSLHCVLFKKASGRPVSNAEINKELYFLHGASTGKLHRLTKEFKPAKRFRRFNWDENRLFTTDPGEYLPKGTKEAIIELIPRLLAEANQIEKNTDSYGLIHFDLNYNNFFINKSSIELFDFDNCSFGYFVNDVSNALYNSVFTYHRNKNGHDHSEFVSPRVDNNLEDVWEPFWRGYKSENVINNAWWHQIGLFFEIIHLKEFVHHYRQKIPYRNEELARIFKEEEMQILNRELPVSFDFTRGKAIQRVREKKI